MNSKEPNRPKPAQTNQNQPKPTKTNQNQTKQTQPNPKQTQTNPNKHKSTQTNTNQHKSTQTNQNQANPLVKQLFHKKSPTQDFIWMTLGSLYLLYKSDLYSK